VALLGLVLSAGAAVLDYGYVSKGATGTTNTVLVFPANNTKSIRLVTLDAQTDLATANLKLYGGTARASVAATAATGQAVIQVSNSGTIDTNDIIVLQKADGTTGHATVSTVAGFTNITCAANIPIALAVGESVYRMSDVRTLRPASTNELRLTGDALFGAQLRNPILIDVQGTSAGRINNAVVKYDPD